MALTVEVTPRAFRDVEREVGWFARHRSAKYADGWHAGIEARMERLADTAASHPEAEEAAELGFPLREAVFARGGRRSASSSSSLAMWSASSASGMPPRTA